MDITCSGGLGFTPRSRAMVLRVSDLSFLGYPAMLPPECLRPAVSFWLRDHGKGIDGIPMEEDLEVEVRRGGLSGGS